MDKDKNLKRVRFLESERLFLTPQIADDFDDHYRWNHDREMVYLDDRYFRPEYYDTAREKYLERIADKSNMCFAVIDKLRECGVSITEHKDGIRVRRKDSIRPTAVTTLPYPGFPTDMQAQMMSMLCLARGISVITEKIYPERFIHVSELSRMGAHILLEGPNAIIKGVTKLKGADVMASDLRASAALVLAGLVAKGKTHVHRIYHLDRGYEHLDKKLSEVGARIWREKEK